MNSSAGLFCCICQKELQDGEDVTCVHQKGADAINAASVQRGDKIVVTPGCKVHSNCRKQHTNSIEIGLYLKKKQGGECGATKRSAMVSEGPFESKTDCLFLWH